MDIVGFLKSAPIVDIGILIAFFGVFFLGAVQGAIRRLLGIMSIMFAFLVAANLRDPLGDYLAQNWHQFDSNYNHLLAFTIVFVIGAVASSIVIQGFYKRTEISAEHPILDDIVGGLLGVLQGMLVLIMVVIILNSNILPPAQSGDISQLRDAQNLIVNQSHIADGVRHVVAPPFLHVLSFLLPSDLVSLFP